MSRPVIISCALTGAGAGSVAKHPGLPKSPAEIAKAGIEAARAGAAIVHIHVREPDTGAASTRLELYKEVVDRIRSASCDVLLNITGGMDGELALVPGAVAEIDRSSTTLRDPVGRMEAALALRPDIASLDCGTMAYGERIFLGRMSDLRAMARLLLDARVKPELECFELGHIENAKRLIAEDLVASPPLFQLCLGTSNGAPATPLTVEAMRALLPANAVWAGFGISSGQMPMVAQMVLSGGHVRVGLEDNLYLRRGQLASNAELVGRAAEIIERLGERVATTDEARGLLGLAGAS